MKDLQTKTITNRAYPKAIVLKELYEGVVDMIGLETDICIRTDSRENVLI